MATTALLFKTWRAGALACGAALAIGAAAPINGVAQETAKQETSKQETSGGVAASEEVASAFDLFSPSAEAREAAIDYYVDRGEPDAIPALIQALRFARSGRGEILRGLRTLAGEDAGATWHDWMLWQEANSQIKPFPGFVDFKSSIYSRIDPAFLTFLRPGVEHEIRLEEIVWGGVVKDGIPALTNPKHISPEEARYITDDELVFGVEINGDARAYPLRMMDWHEMFNDVIGGVPVSLAYCTLCGSGILFETTAEGRDEPFVFGSSGFLYRSNKLMYDQQTHSLWNQFTGRAVVGPLTGSGLELKTRPVVIASWENWLESHPDTTVLSLETGFVRDYEPGRPYGDYFSSPELMFPAQVGDRALKPKDYVFALRGAGTEKAWPLTLFEGGRVVNDVAGAIPVTLIGDAKTRTVRAYRTTGQKFEPGVVEGAVLLDGQQWRVTEEGIVGPEGDVFTRLPGHIAYWFAWSGYLGDGGELASAVN